MKAPLDIWALGALLSLFGLLATIRLSLPSLIGRRIGGIANLATHPAWLVPFIFGIAVAVGLMIEGALSPWPPAAHAAYAADFGPWAGVAAFLLVVIVDLWLVWTPSMVARRFARLESLEAVKALTVLNVPFGLLFIGIILLIWR